MYRYKSYVVAILTVAIASIFLVNGCVTIVSPKPSLSPPTSPIDDDRSNQQPGVTSPPVINSFTANPTEIGLGETSTLEWDVSDVLNVVIEPGVGELSHTGSHVVAPDADTTYMLTATNSLGSATKSVSVQVIVNDASKLALTESDVRRRGWVLSSVGTPIVEGTISTYSITFTRREEILVNSVYTYSGTGGAERRFYGIGQTGSKPNTQPIYAIGNTRAFVDTDVSEMPDGDEKFLVGYIKNNVYVEMGYISGYQELLDYANIVEQRIQ